MQRRPRLTPAMAAVRRAVASNLAAALGAGLLEPGDLVLAACSGGADSLALVEGLLFAGPRAGLRVGAVVVDHGLQPAAAAVAEQTSVTLSARGCQPVLLKRVTLGSAGGTEAAARAARYAALEAAAAETGAKAIALGHTQNDQAETVLLGLLRGSGARSLAGMRGITPIPTTPQLATTTQPAKTAVGYANTPEQPSAATLHYLRPLLAVDRATTEAACTGVGLEFWQDPMNADLDYTRAKLRHAALPALAAALGPELGAGLVASLSKTADILREDNDYLDTLSKEIFAAFATVRATEVWLPVALIAEQPAAVRGRVVGHALRALGTPNSHEHIAAVVRLATDWHGQGPLHLPGIRVGRTGGEIHLKSTKTLKPGAC